VNYSRAYCSAPEKAEEEVSPKVTEILEKLKQLTFVEIMSLGTEFVLSL
jgi:hypothetical protein